ncbi:metal-dependent hydrolase [Mesonia mobilis]|uniref:Membrane protein n=1 Tax=Mesonia mobilis TaxID=369791 RepID=A0ABQ3BQ27_9FLAO|nr:metal-dependent hydrolase [Mesonia mobilis]MBQ0738411.1 metal-dependent hydrolase [Aquimarina celericrescens]GGZ53930.1 membrane protein [Mesonia mobilis]
MDSLTQIVLGAAVGEAVLGKKVGNKAMLYGAIAGTIPDFDTFASHFTDTVTALEIHRGFTHSIVFSVVFAPVFGWLVSRWEKTVSWKNWSWLFFWGFLTHPLLDAHTTWGTQLFWPLDLRLAYKNIFVIDPLYTLPFLVFVILAMRKKRTSPKRRKLNNLGLIISSAYMLLTLILKGITYQKFTEALQQQNIQYSEIETKPSPFNTILWTANVDTKDAYLIGHYSFFDTKPIQFTAYPKNHEWLEDLKDEENVQRLIKITKGWYTITKENEKLYLNDLRFGLLGFSPSAKNFTFSFQLEKKNGKVIITEKEKDTRDAKKLLSELWERILGN